MQGPLPSSRLFYDCSEEGGPCVCDGTGLAEALLGLDGFKVLDVAETGGELTVMVETVVVEGCPGCGPRPRIDGR